MSYLQGSMFLHLMEISLRHSVLVQKNDLLVGISGASTGQEKRLLWAGAASWWFLPPRVALLHPVLTVPSPSFFFPLPRESPPQSWLPASSILAAASTGNWTSTRMGLLTWQWAPLAMLWFCGWFPLFLTLGLSWGSRWIQGLKDTLQDLCPLSLIIVSQTQPVLIPQRLQISSLWNDYKLFWSPKPSSQCSSKVFKQFSVKKPLTICPKSSGDSGISSTSACQAT